jgi:hypothetical protein
MVNHIGENVMNFRADLLAHQLALAAAQEQVKQAGNNISAMLLPIVFVLDPMFVTLQADYPRVTEWHEDGESVQVNVVWECRAGTQSEWYTIPFSILDAEDPIEAARQYRVERKAKENAASLLRMKAEQERLAAAIRTAESN